MNAAASSVSTSRHIRRQWTAQQMVEAFPFDTAPQYLIRDHDGTYVLAIRS